VDNIRLAALFGFEQLASRLSRKHPHQRAKRAVARCISRRGRSATNDWRNTSSSLALLRPRSAMIRLPVLIVDSRFAFVMTMNGRHLSAAPNAWRLPSSAEGVFGAVIAS
jgi:hypothetical protein